MVMAGCTFDEARLRRPVSNDASPSLPPVADGAAPANDVGDAANPEDTGPLPDAADGGVDVPAPDLGWRDDAAHDTPITWGMDGSADGPSGETDAGPGMDVGDTVAGEAPTASGCGNGDGACDAPEDGVTGLDGTDDGMPGDMVDSPSDHPVTDGADAADSRTSLDGGDGPARTDVVVNDITEFTVNTGDSQPRCITVGSDGNLWFTERLGNKIGRMTPAGSMVEFDVPTPNSNLEGITLGPDGNIWFAESGGNKIGRITPTGTITEYVIPSNDSGPEDIVTASDNNLWFTEYNSKKIGRITPTGNITETQLINAPSRIASGPDGNLWFTETSANYVVRFDPTPAGLGGITFTPFNIPTASGGLDGIVAGPDGNLWFGEAASNKIGRITPTGTVAEFNIPTLNSSGTGGTRVGIAAGPDGNVWFTEFGANNVARATPTGTITEFPIPTANSAPYGIVAGPDGNLWFTESVGNKIARIAP